MKKFRSFVVLMAVCSALGSAIAGCTGVGPALPVQPSHGTALLPADVVPQLPGSIYVRKQ
jgi:hypothetical protein